MLNRRVDSPCCIAVLHRGVASRCCIAVLSSDSLSDSSSDSPIRFVKPTRQSDSPDRFVIRFAHPIRQTDSSIRFVRPIRQTDSSIRFVQPIPEVPSIRDPSRSIPGGYQAPNRVLHIHFSRPEKFRFRGVHFSQSMPVGIPPFISEG